MKRVTAAIACIMVLLLALLANGQGSRADDVADRGEIRLTSPLSAMAWQLAVGPQDGSLLVSGRDGTVSLFDLNDEYGERSVFYSPIRDEEPEKQRPIAISPTGDLIALGAPLERRQPQSAKIYFFRRFDTAHVLFTIEGLPSRPIALRFNADRGGKRLLLAAALADGRPPRIWDVTAVAEAARDPAHDLAAIEHVLPEPAERFFADCGREECHTWMVAFPPTADSEVGLAVAADSGLVLYDRNFQVAAYANWRERPDLRRAASISFSGDAGKFAVGKLGLTEDEKKRADNFACAVDVYDVGRLRDLAGEDRKFKKEPSVRLQAPPTRYETQHCAVARVAWAGNSIFAAGEYIREFDDKNCTTFKALADEYGVVDTPEGRRQVSEANAMLRWKSLDDRQPDAICIGTNTAMDVQPLAAGGVAVVTQDPSVFVYDSDGMLSRYPGHARSLRSFEGRLLEMRDAGRAEMSTDRDGSVVLIRPLRAPRAYFAFDLKAKGIQDALIRAVNSDLSAARRDVVGEINARRGAAVDFPARSAPPAQCLGLEFPPTRTQLDLVNVDFTSLAVHRLLNLRPPEVVRDVEFVPPDPAGGAWKVAIGTSHSLLYVDCEGHDLWNGGRTIASPGSGGIALRDDAYRVRVTPDRRFIIAAHGDGIIRWYQLSSGKLTLSLFVHPDLRRWIAWTPEGYFDSSQDAGDHLAGWLQSSRKPKGAWSVDIEPLSKYEKQWRNPVKVRQAASSDGASTATATGTALTAPNQGKPKLDLEIDQPDAIDTATLRFRIRIENAGDRPPADLPKFDLFAETMGRIQEAKYKDPVRKDQDWILAGEFKLNDCLQTPDRRSKIWVQFSEPELADRLPSRQFITYRGPKAGTCPRPKVWGIFIGVSKYQPGNPDLHYADQDAKRMFEFWKDQSYYDRGKMVLLESPAAGPTKQTTRDPNGSETSLSADSSLASIQTLLHDTLNEFKNRTTGIRPSDLLVIYFAGHGMARWGEELEHWYFLPTGATGVPDRTATIPTREISDDLAGIDPAVSIFVLVDACRNYAVSNPEADVNHYRPRFELNNLASTYNAAVYVASGTNQFAEEFPEPDLANPDPKTCNVTQPPAARGGGAFTHALLDQLRKAEAEGTRLQRFAEDVHARALTICSRQDPKFMPTDRGFETLFLPR